MSRRRVLVGLVFAALCLVALSYAGASAVDPPTESTPDTSSPPDPKLVQPADNVSKLYPYTSKRRSTSGRTLPINVVIHGDPGDVRTALTDRSDLGFEELPAEESEAGNETYQIDIEDSELDWNDASGSPRYIYIQDDGGGRWLRESYQLHEGNYMGERQHIRAYEDPDGEYTAIQIHREYFDFFQLRHNVVDIEDSGQMLEDEFLDQPFVDRVSREYFGTRGRWTDGWTVSIHLGALIPTALFGVFALGSVVSASTRRAVWSLTRNFGSWARTNWAGFVLAAGLVVTVVGTRAFALALENTFTETYPQVFAGVAYPILALGPPAVVAVLARRLSPLPAFGFAVFGLVAALAADTMWVGLGVVPVQVFLHRFGLALTLGVLALGVAREVSDDPEAIDEERGVLIAAGLLAWFGGLALPLFGMV
ncbi:hypothetical protein GRX03_07210 [Halovenus sp. WSH3]|uniref:Uncharacterized protein n=1 Tax=Halovenus carboxidivorans TaxID=2692199 RepID=A0A6B0T952_9EURY|nr:hypothetical protein [Halovenus carboxidivorans]MXR51390.1 hypothetical protein [Halovenus carboxidivorans]